MTTRHHHRRQLCRKRFANGKDCHILECCNDCGTNVRGPGVWVGRREVLALGMDPDTLPTVPEQAAGPPQPSLFRLEDL